jgi:hypothetical protein
MTRLNSADGGKSFSFSMCCPPSLARRHAGLRAGDDDGD